MAEQRFWTLDHFPVVYEGGEPKAVLVDMASFAQVELILDNLLNREGEPEDAILAASDGLHQILDRALAGTPSSDWERDLNEL